MAGLQRVFDERAFYAHSAPNRDDWELLSVHLSEVAEETACPARAGKFGCSSLAEAAGRLHDLGKFKAAFQSYIRGGSNQGKSHSGAGAVYARQKLGRLGGLIAHAIAGHHAGLKDGLLARDGRLDREAGELDLALSGVAGAPEPFALPGVPTPPPEFKSDGAAGPSGFQLAFLTRMLFSCLVDADRFCTARFFARLHGPKVEPGPSATVKRLSKELVDWMSRQDEARAAEGAAGSAINRRRAEILAHVRGHAEDPLGVFTLTVPTGGGKTLTSLDFALRHAAHHDLDRVIVVIPFTSVIEQSAVVYRKALGEFAGEVLEHHSAFDEENLRGEERQGLAKLQLAMENWDARIVVTTAVQFFESLFSNRPSQCRKLHNIAKSVVVLDEAQTVPLHLLRPCVAALKELQRNYGSSVVLSTATQPALIERDDPDRSFPGGFREPTELAPDVPALFEALRRVTVRSVGEQDDQALRRRFEAAPQALCIVNRRDHARELYGRIVEHEGARHLSTLMHAAHRSRVLAEVRADLKDGRPCRVVSTSLIEAGVDVDFPLVMRAEAGLDQIAQAAGRLNREFRRSAEESCCLVFKEAGRKPFKDLQPNVDTGNEILRRFATDPIGPAAIEAYFGLLYWKRGRDDPDRHGVLRECDDKLKTLDFPFEQIARDMRLIEDVMRPVIVANDDESRRWLDELKDPRSREPLGAIARKLQRYAVGVPERDRATLLAEGVAAAVRADAFGDQFIELLNLDLYKPEVGLDCSNPLFVQAGRYVL